MNLYLEGYQVETLTGFIGEYLANNSNDDLESIYTKLATWLLED